MTKPKIKKSELVNGRLSILLFWSLLMGALLWAERNAWGRTNLIFREMLPWLMPIVFGVFGLIAIVLILLWKKGFTRRDKLFSTPFLFYMVAAPFLATLLPWATIFFPATQLFGIFLDFLFVALIGYFISYIFFAKVSPAAGLLAGFTTLCAAVLVGHHQIYITVANAFLQIDHYPDEKLIAPIVAVVLLALLIVLRLAAQKKELALKKIALLIPFAVSALIPLASAFFRSLILVSARGWLVLGGIAVLALWLIGYTVGNRIKNRK